MTWSKFGNEYFDQLANMDFPDDIADACQLTHTQAIHYLYSVEEQALTFKKSMLHRFATSPQADRAADTLVSLGVWSDQGQKYEIVHHSDVIRQSLGYQLKERDRKKTDQRRRRSKESGPPGPDGGVAQQAPQHVARNVDGTQSVSQSFSQQRRSELPSTETEEQDPPFDPATGEVLDPPGLSLVSNVYAENPDEFDAYVESSLPSFGDAIKEQQEFERRYGA